MTISPVDALKRLRQGNVSLLDVRSQGEFSKGSFPGAKNIPILNDIHRHEVGLTYRLKGSDAAVALGHQLVAPLKASLLAQWAQFYSSSKSVAVCCWRGGLRSKIASQWMLEAGLSVLRVESGFKGMRSVVLGAFQAPQPLVVLGGMTGSGKTKLLREFPSSLDLEAMANHRGSAFGLLLGETQPAQTTFENILGVQLLAPWGVRIVEDESPGIGNCRIPTSFYRQMRQSPFVQVEVSRRIRAENIFEEYVLGYEKSGIPPEKVREYFRLCLEKISHRLGGMRFSKLAGLLDRGFSQGMSDREAHIPWIAALLEEYYDPQYQYSLQKKGRPIWFRGSIEECRQWLGSFVSTTLPSD